MSTDTKIEWADHTFNPWIGCTKVSPGCDNCYAEAWDRRFALSGHDMHWGAGKARKLTKTWGDPVKWNRQHEAFFSQHGRRQRVFCASLADVFDNAVDPQWRVDLFKLMESTPNLDWLLLTKRIGNVGNMLPVPFDFDKHYPNVWIGATIVNQEDADRDIPKLLDVPAVKRFLSMEPLLGPVDLASIRHTSGYGCGPCASCEAPVFINSLFGNSYCKNSCDGPDHAAIDWVIVGGESGPNARPMHPDWARSLRDQCVTAGVPFLFKQWGEFLPHSELYPGEISRHVCVPMPGEPRSDSAMARVGKKAAGRLLDGLTWDEVPA